MEGYPLFKVGDYVHTLAQYFGEVKLGEVLEAHYDYGSWLYLVRLNDGGEWVIKESSLRKGWKV